MVSVYIFLELHCDFRCGDIHNYRDQSYHLGQFTDDVHYSRVSIVCCRKWNNEVHGDNLPFCTWWFDRLKKTEWFVIPGLCLLASPTTADVLLNSLSEVFPIVEVLDTIPCLIGVRHLV